MKNFTFPLMEGDTATLTVPHPMSEENFTMLMAIIQASKPGFVSPKKDIDFDPLDDTPSTRE